MLEEAAELALPHACSRHSARFRCAWPLSREEVAAVTNHTEPSPEPERLGLGSLVVGGGSGSVCRRMFNSLYPLDASNDPSCDNPE